MDETLLVLGASVRAAAFSAQRAGFSAIAADMFADRDLVARCPTTHVWDYPSGLNLVAEDAPPCAWFYTGALENEPNLVDRISEKRALYGNPGRVLVELRNPLHLAAALAREGLPNAEVRLSEATLDAGKWLRKPWKSCGGGGIDFFERPRSPTAGPAERQFENQGPHDRVATGRQGRRKWFFQRFVDGAPCSAAYVAAAGRASLIGVTRQLIGAAWTGAAGFRYAGSLGPLPLEDRERDLFARIGDCLARRFDLQGLFGVDAVRNDEGIWPVEVNPRYTASIEVLERALGVQAIAEHVFACRVGRLPAMQPCEDGLYCGKAVVYARAVTTISCDLDQLAVAREDEQSWPNLADMPAIGARIERGRPLATVFAAGGTAKLAYVRLRQRVRRLQEILAC